MADHYELLGVAPDAGHDEIKQAYKRLARRHHPDTLGAAPDEAVEAARRRMAAINAAWTVLGDPDRRRDYDEGAALRAAAPPDTAGAGNRRAGPEPGFPDWFEPDDEVPAAFLEEDVEGGDRRPASLLTFLPVGLAAAAVAAFAMSVVVDSPGLLALALVLAPLTLVAFFLAPLVAMATRARSEP